MFGAKDRDAQRLFLAPYSIIPGGALGDPNGIQGIETILFCSPIDFLSIFQVVWPHCSSRTQVHITVLCQLSHDALSYSLVLPGLNWTIFLTWNVLCLLSAELIIWLPLMHADLFIGFSSTFVYKDFRTLFLT